MRKTSCLGIAALAIAALPTIAQASDWVVVQNAAAGSTDNRYVTKNIGGYILSPDAWGSGTNPFIPFTFTGRTGTNFWMTMNVSGSGIKAWAHSEKSKNQTVASYDGNTATIGCSGTTGAFDYAFDNWQPQETMIWNRWANTQPRGGVATNGWSDGKGRTWNIWHDSNGNVNSFVATSQFTSGSVAIGKIMSKVASQYGGTNLQHVMYGVEIISGNSTWTITNGTYP